jgi:V8-like Glu-specific endopeptidase
MRATIARLIRIVKILQPSIWFFLVIACSTLAIAQSDADKMQVRTASVLDGKLIQQPLVRLSNDEAYVQIPTKGQVKVDDPKNLLSKHPDLDLTFELKSIGAKKAEVIDSKLPEVSKWQADLDKKIEPEKHGQLEDVTQAINDLDRESKSALQTGNYANANAIVEKYGLVKDQIVKTYAKIPKEDHSTRTLLSSLYLKSKSSQKAWYGRDDNYRPQVYEMIYERSRSCVGITKHNKTDLKGSGILIGSNTVLTANHVVEDAVDANEFDVLLDYEQVLDEQTKEIVNAKTTIRRQVERVYFAGISPDSKTSPLDYVLLELKPAAQSQQRPPVPITMERVVPETPIFLVGHPRQAPRMVHDNSWVKFPYKVSASEYERLLVIVNGELIGVGDAAQEADKFIRFYKMQSDDTTHKTWYTYIDQRDGNAEPCIGAECDTFHGDSGAPAMLRESGEIIGILVAGEPDQDVLANEERVKSNAYTAGWIHHERLLPVVAIVEQLDKEKPTWSQECGVTVIR